MSIYVTKTIPTSSRYSGGGTGSATTITLSGINNIAVNCKKSLIKTQIGQAPGNWGNPSNSSDLAKTFIMDLKKIEDTIKIRGWVEDSGTTSALSAWNKAWQLRAMVSSGGPLTTLAVENITFSSTPSAGNAAAYLEEVSFVSDAGNQMSKTINTPTYKGIARIEIDCSFYIGDAR